MQNRIHKERKIRGGAHSETLITIIYSDSYELLKNDHRPAKDDHRPNTAQSNESNTAQSNNDEKPVQDTLATGNIKSKKPTTAQPINSLNKYPPPNQQDLTRTNNNDIVYERHCPDDAIYKNKLTQEGVQASQKYKLTKDEIDSLAWLESQKINTPIKNLCWWAKNYSLKRLKDVHKAACNVKKPKSIAALMTTFLKNDTPVECDFVRENSNFLPGFVEQYPEFEWKIEKSYVTCQLGNIKKEVPLKYAPNVFLETILRVINNLKGKS